MEWALRLAFGVSERDWVVVVVVGVVELFASWVVELFGGMFRAHATNDLAPRNIHPEYSGRTRITLLWLLGETYDQVT
jgi:hypothetical protein